MVVDGSPTSAQKDDDHPYPIFPTSLGHKHFAGPGGDWSGEMFVTKRCWKDRVG